MQKALLLNYHQFYSVEKCPKGYATHNTRKPHFPQLETTKPFFEFFLQLLRKLLLIRRYQKKITKEVTLKTRNTFS